VMERALVLCEGSEIGVEHLPVEKLRLERMASPPVTDTRTPDAGDGDGDRERTRILGAMTEFGGNVTDLTTRLVGDLYLLVAEVDVPASAAERLTERLTGVAGVLNVEVALRPGEADVL